jgi:hypothetical protein
MGWFQSKQEQLVKNLQEEQAYALAAHEIASREIRPGLWAKAFAEASGDEQRARAIYIKLRVAQVKLGVEVTAEMLAKAGPSTALKPVQPTETSSVDGCRFCGNSNVARHSKTNAPTWCFACQKDL